VERNDTDFGLPWWTCQELDLAMACGRPVAVIFGELSDSFIGNFSSFRCEQGAIDEAFWSWLGAGMLGSIRRVLPIAGPLFALLFMGGSGSERLHADESKPSAQAAPPKNDPEKDRLEKQKLQEEIAKLQSEVAALGSNASIPGQFLPWLQVLGLGSLIGGLLVLMAGKGLSSVQRKKLDQDLKFARED
jgi:hypothetical protein